MLARRPDGKFSNREVSAVLYVWEDLTGREQRLRAKVFHHPEPFVRLPQAVFAHIPQTRFRPIDGDSAAIEFGRRGDGL
jgi:hypothetical protein